MKFQRTPPPRKFKDYHRYRQHTRSDFRRVCAHCFRHEEEAGGEEHFVQDHFEPKHRPSVDPSDYLNLYWSCVACNSRQNKGVTWPTSEEHARGEHFCDPCHHDPVGTDYTEQDDGHLEALTPAGAYTIRHIRLSERNDLISHRIRRRRIRHTFLDRLGRLHDALESWRGNATRSGSITAIEKCDKLSKLVTEYETFVQRDPFMIVDVPQSVPLDLIEGL